MSFNLNATSNTVAVSGNVAVGFPVGATVVTRSGTNAGAVADLYIVTAGKTLYIINAWASGTAFQVNAILTVSVQADVLGDGTYRQLCGANANNSTTLTGSTCNCSVSFPIPIPIPATKKVQSNCTTPGGSSAVTVGFTGYEI